MSSSGQSQSEVSSERVSIDPRSVETESRCTYPNERRERNQIYALLNISNEPEERSLECVNGTGWEDAVQGWNKTAPFTYLQLQKKARRTTRTSESVGGCLYCLDMTQVPDKCLEQDPKTIDPLKSDYKLSSSAATDSIPEKPEPLLSSCTSVSSSSATEDAKKESCYGKVFPAQPFSGDKKKPSIKEAQASLSERKAFLLKESQLFQAEKKTVPIREYSILPPSKPKSLETLKGKDSKRQESSVCNLVSSETSLKPSLPPLKESTLKSNLDSSPKKSKAVLSQAREKTYCAVSETVSRTQVFKPNQHRFDKEIELMGSAVKEPIKLHEIPSSVSKLPRTSVFARNSDRYYWRCALLQNKKLATMPNWIALKRNNQLNSMHCLHTKGDQGSKAHETREPCARSRSHSGSTLGNEPKTQGTPLLSGLFPSLTEHSWGRSTYECFRIPQKISKRRRISKMVSDITCENVTSTPQERMGWITQLAQFPTRHDRMYKEETASVNKRFQFCSIRPSNYPMTTASDAEKRVSSILDSVQTNLGVKRTLPVKEYENRSFQRCPEPLQCKKIGLPKVVPSDPPSSFNCVTLNALLVFRPDREGIINVHLEPPPKKKEAPAAKRAEKESSTTARNASYIRGTKKGKLKGGKKVGRTTITKKQIKKSCNTR